MMAMNNDCIPLCLDAGARRTNGDGGGVTVVTRSSRGPPSLINAAAAGGSSSSSSSRYTPPSSTAAGADTADEETTAMIKRANNKKKVSRRKNKSSFSTSSLCPATAAADDYYMITTDYHHHTTAAGSGCCAGEAAANISSTRGVLPFGNKPAGAGGNLLTLLKTRTAGDDNSSSSTRDSRRRTSENEEEEDECLRRMNCCAKNSSPSCCATSPPLYESDKGRRIEKTTTKNINCTLQATTFSSSTSRRRNSSPGDSKNQFDRHREQHMKKRVCTSTTCMSTNKEHCKRGYDGGQNTGVDMINLLLQASQQDHVKKKLRKLPDEPVPDDHSRSSAGHNFISPYSTSKKTTIKPIDRAELEEGHPTMTSATLIPTAALAKNGYFCNLFPAEQSGTGLGSSWTAKEASIAVTAGATSMQGSISRRSTAAEYSEADRQHYGPDNSILRHHVSCRTAGVDKRQTTSRDNISPSSRVQLKNTRKRGISVTAPASDATIPADTTTKKNSGTTAISRTTTDKTQEDSSGNFWPAWLLLEQEHTLNMKGLPGTSQSWNSLLLPSRNAHHEKVGGDIHHTLGEQTTTIQQRNQTLQECFVNDDCTIRQVRQEGFLESGNVSSANDMLSRWRSRRECSQADDYLHPYHHSVLDRMQCFYKALLPEQIQNGSDLSIKFPWKLFYILECGDYSNVCQWNRDGNAFYITNIVGFEKSVLRNICKTEKFASFQRQLYRWNFFKCNEKMTPQNDRTEQNDEKHLAYKHEQFRRGNWMQVKTIQCRTRFLSKKELETKREAKNKRRNLATNNVGPQEPTCIGGASVQCQTRQAFLSCHDDSSSVSPDSGTAASKLHGKKVAQSSSSYYTIDDKLLGLLNRHASESYAGSGASREGLVLSYGAHVTGTKIEQDRFGSPAMSLLGSTRTSVSGDPLWDGSCYTTPIQHNFPVVSSSHISSQMDEEIFRLRQENMMIAMAIIRDSQQKNDQGEGTDVLLNILSQQHDPGQASTSSPKFRSGTTNLMNHVPSSYHSSTFQTGAFGLPYRQQRSIAINDNSTPATVCFNANSLVAAAGALATTTRSPLDTIRTTQNFPSYELTNRHNAIPATCYYNSQASSILCRMAGLIPSYESTNHNNAIPATHYNSQASSILCRMAGLIPSYESTNHNNAIPATHYNSQAISSILCRMAGQDTSNQKIVVPPEDANRSQVQQAQIDSCFGGGSTTSFEYKMHFHKI